MRDIKEKEYSHEKLGSIFMHSLSDYDTKRRVEVLVDSFLGNYNLEGRRVIDVGCGFGFFSKRLTEYGAHVTACDLGQNLVNQTKQLVGCNGIVADCMELDQYFEPESFDIVLSSECIEHTPDPETALIQMIKLLKPGGVLVISTPNVLWWPVVKAASLIKLRPYEGYENFSSWRSLRRIMMENKMEVIKEAGLHLFPFQFGLHRLSRWIDLNLQVLRPLMINLCMLSRKVVQEERKY